MKYDPKKVRVFVGGQEISDSAEFTDACVDDPLAREMSETAPCRTGMSSSLSLDFSDVETRMLALIGGNWPLHMVTGQGKTDTPEDIEDFYAYTDKLRALGKQYMPHWRRLTKGLTTFMKYGGITYSDVEKAFSGYDALIVDDCRPFAKLTAPERKTRMAKRGTERVKACKHNNGKGPRNKWGKLK